jgi:hypothetical protein
MASPNKLAANRANAHAGTGPRTAVGRARSAGNARRHGLNIPVLSDRWLSAEVEALAHEIAGLLKHKSISFARGRDGKTSSPTLCPSTGTSLRNC